MLEGLDRIDWENLTHAYGSAGDVPKLIWQLLDPDEEVREQALDALFGTIWHQGTVYEATAYAAPFLIELVAEPATKNRHQILLLISLMADGHGYYAVHGRFTHSPEARAAEEFQARLAREHQEVKSAFEAVVAGVETYLSLLHDDDPIVRSWAAALVTTATERSSEIEQMLKAQLEIETDPTVKADMLLSLVNCWCFPGFRPDKSACLLSGVQIGQLLAWMRAAAEPLEVRVTAACSLLKYHTIDLLPEAVPLFNQAMLMPTDKERFARPFEQASGRGVIYRVTEALEAHPRVLLDWVLAQVDHPDPEIQQSVLFSIERICQQWRWAAPIGVAAILKCLEGNNGNLRLHAAATMSRMGRAAEIATAALQRAQNDENPATRNWAKGTLENLAKGYDLHSLSFMVEREQAPQGTIDQLEQALEQRDSWGRVYAARALWRVAGAASTEKIMPVLLDSLNGFPYGLLAIDCFRQMGRHAEAAVPELIEIANSERRFSTDIWLDEALQEQAVIALVAIQTESLQN